MQRQGVEQKLNDKERLIETQIKLMEIHCHDLQQVKTQIDRESKLISENLICNLSKIKLNSQANSLLKKGFSYAPMTQKLGKNTVSQGIEHVNEFIGRITRRLNAPTKQTLVSNNSNLNLNLKTEQPYLTRSKNPQPKVTPSLAQTMSKVMFLSNKLPSYKYTPNDLSNSIAVRLLKNRLTLTARNISLKYRTNLSTFEKSEFSKIYKMCKNKEIIIRKADKSQQIVLLDQIDYSNAIKKLLAVESNYIKIPFNEKFKTAAKIISTVKTLGVQLLSEQERNWLLSYTKNPKDRMFYGLPKTHKPKEKWDKIPPIRPICPDINTETCITGKLIAHYLSPLWLKIATYTKNSYDLVKLIESLKNIPNAAILLVADVDNLYPSLPIQETFKRVKRKLLAETTHSEIPGAEFVLKLLQIQLDNNCFCFENQYYKQIKGIPMGKAWAPIVASIYLDFWEQEILKKTEIKPLLFVRYIDDVFLVVNSKAEALNLINCFQTNDCNIKLSEFTVASTVNFLDLTLTLRNGLISYKIYTKPSHLRVLLDFSSAHSFSLKCSVVLSQLIRFYRLHSDLKEAGRAMFVFIKLMIIHRQLKPLVARAVWKRFLKWLRTPRQQVNERSEKFLNLALFMPNNTFTNPLKRSIEQFYASLQEKDQSKLGPLQIKQLAGRTLGRQLFFP